jgi:hypothetical protein
MCWSTGQGPAIPDEINHRDAYYKNNHEAVKKKGIPVWLFYVKEPSAGKTRADELMRAPVFSRVS